jgi:flavin reductase (DIM6/NTAB) family NADH-FMN oxidoreductase RutF
MRNSSSSLSVRSATGPATDPPDRLLRAVFRGHPAGVAIITCSQDGKPFGATVTSVASVSASPPVISFSLARSLSAFTAFSRAGLIGVHFLTVGHEELARTFATSGIERFAGVPWTMNSAGVPELRVAGNRLLVSPAKKVAIGSSSMFLADVVSGESDSHHYPLVYQAGEYHRLSRSEP